ncbi:hypothetical protein [Lentzea sp. NBRC 102530]|uniref:hypothetical protein n=1 Tax=Lentzea sp. NBRC 102530 TaxID=3032201 RepID=UPI0024A26406|nr:hypothetical protein [Lentzea sp. NBRC 102530]GLY55209.1 hypothetical protein Lesp01_88640 [Lentzea sp. NBRC 102530]
MPGPLFGDCDDVVTANLSPGGLLFRESVVRRAFEELRQDVARGLDELWQWTPPWEPSREILDEIRREAGALDEDQAPAAPSYPSDEDKWWMARVTAEEVRRQVTNHRWGQTIDESHHFRFTPPVFTLDPDEVTEWVRRAVSVELAEWQVEWIKATYGPRSVDGREVPARFYLNGVARRNGRGPGNR